MQFSDMAPGLNRSPYTYNQCTITWIEYVLNMSQLMFVKIGNYWWMTWAIEITRSMKSKEILAFLRLLFATIPSVKQTFTHTKLSIELYITKFIFKSKIQTAFSCTVSEILLIGLWPLKHDHNLRHRRFFLIIQNLMTQRTKKFHSTEILA